jgi:hypothetical protein
MQPTSLERGVLGKNCKRHIPPYLVTTRVAFRYLTCDAFVDMTSFHHQARCTVGGFPFFPHPWLAIGLHSRSSRPRGLFRFERRNNINDHCKSEYHWLSPWPKFAPKG